MMRETERGICSDRVRKILYGRSDVMNAYRKGRWAAGKNRRTVQLKPDREGTCGAVDRQTGSRTYDPRKRPSAEQRIYPLIDITSNSFAAAKRQFINVVGIKEMSKVKVGWPAAYVRVANITNQAAGYGIGYG